MDQFDRRAERRDPGRVGGRGVDGRHGIRLDRQSLHRHPELGLAVGWAGSDARQQRSSSMTPRRSRSPFVLPRVRRVGQRRRHPTRPAPPRRIQPLRTPAPRPRQSPSTTFFALTRPWSTRPSTLHHRAHVDTTTEPARVRRAAAHAHPPVQPRRGHRGLVRRLGRGAGPAAQPVRDERAQRRPAGRDHDGQLGHFGDQSESTVYVLRPNGTDLDRSRRSPGSARASRSTPFASSATSATS